MKPLWRYFAATCAILIFISIWDGAIRAGYTADFTFFNWLELILASLIPTAMIASTAFLLGDYGYLICMPAAVWGILCTAIEMFFQGYFADCGQKGGAFSVRFLTLNWQKVFDFLFHTNLLYGILMIAAIVALIFAIAWLTRMQTCAPSIRSIAIGAVIFGTASCALPRTLEHDRLIPALSDHIFLGGYRNDDTYWLAKSGERVDDGLFSTAETNLLAVVVIGESASAPHWSLYGYPRKTTPNLDKIKDELLICPSLTVSKALTSSALLDSFTWQHQGKLVSIPSVLVSAGYAGSLIATQVQAIKLDGPHELMFEQCGTRKYLNQPNDKAEFDHIVLDDKAIPEIAAIIDGVQSNQAVFVHTDGSHSQWHEHYPPEFEHYSPDFTDDIVDDLGKRERRNVNAYDNTIVFTDFVLSQIIETVRATNRKAIVIYISDHGETPRTYARDEHCPEELYSVPFFIWPSPQFCKEAPERLETFREIIRQPLKSPDFPSIVLQLLSVREPPDK